MRTRCRGRVEGCGGRGRRSRRRCATRECREEERRAGCCRTRIERRSSRVGKVSDRRVCGRRVCLGAGDGSVSLTARGSFVLCCSGENVLQPVRQRPRTYPLRLLRRRPVPNRVHRQAVLRRITRQLVYRPRTALHKVQVVPSIIDVPLAQSHSTIANRLANRLPPASAASSSTVCSDVVRGRRFARNSFGRTTDVDPESADADAFGGDEVGPEGWRVVASDVEEAAYAKEGNDVSREFRATKVGGFLGSRERGRASERRSGDCNVPGRKECDDDACKDDDGDLRAGGGLALAPHTTKGSAEGSDGREKGGSRRLTQVTLRTGGPVSARTTSRESGYAPAVGEGAVPVAPVAPGRTITRAAPGGHGISSGVRLRVNSEREGAERGAKPLKHCSPRPRLGTKQALNSLRSG